MIDVRNRRHLFAAYALITLTAVAARFLSWPGLVTHDSLFVTIEAISGEYTTYHPLLNTLLMRVLVVPVGSYALFTSLQIVLAALLFARSITLVVESKEERSARWLPLASVAIWMLSLHTWLYMGMVWKDVLSGYAVAYLCAHVYRARTSTGNPLCVGWVDTILFACALILATKLRHGMEINFIIVPLLMGFKTLWAASRLRNGYILAVAFAVLLSALSNSSFVRVDEGQRLHKARLTAVVAAQPFLGIISNRNGYSSDDHEYDRRLAEYVFGRMYKQDFAPDYFNNHVELSDPDALERSVKAIIIRTPRLCMLNVAQCVSGRIQMMLATLQPSTTRGGMVFYDLALLPCASYPDMPPQACEVLDRFARQGKPSLAVWIESVIMKSTVGSGNALSNVYAWNMLPALFVIVIGLLLFTPKNALWVACAFVSLQMILPFMTATANDFRYYYFLWLTACVIAPVLVYELYRNRTTRLLAGKGSRAENI